MPEPSARSRLPSALRVGINAIAACKPVCIGSSKAMGHELCFQILTASEEVGVLVLAASYRCTLSGFSMSRTFSIPEPVAPFGLCAPRCTAATCQSSSL